MIPGIIPDQADLSDPEFRSLSNEIYFGRDLGRTISRKSFRGEHNARKIWETTRVALELRRAGALVPKALALGIGVGIEPLQFYLANQGVFSIGTDLYGFGWSSAPLDMLYAPASYAPYDYDHACHATMQMDGLKLLFPDECIDVIYSVSSVEHFGGLPGLKRHLDEARRVLKPGGVLVFSTELCLQGDNASHDWCFSQAQLNHQVRVSGLRNLIGVKTADQARVGPAATLQMPNWTIRAADWAKLAINLNGMTYTSVVLALGKES